LKFQEQQQGSVADEAEPFMGSGRFGKLIYLSLFLFSGVVKIQPLRITACIFILLTHISILTARAYLLGYNCADEKELEATLRFC